jgi:transcriptional regulator with XRE-family HTH domain
VKNNENKDLSPIVERIIQVRKSLDLNQTKFAEKSGMSRNFVNRMENGEFQPSDRTISDVCRRLNINENWLRTGEGEMKSQTEDEYMKMWVDLVTNDDETKKAIMAFYKLSPNQRKEIWNVIRILAKATEYVINLLRFFV